MAAPAGTHARSDDVRMVGIDWENSKRQGFTNIDNARVMGVVMIVVMVTYNMARINYELRH